MGKGLFWCVNQGMWGGGEGLALGNFFADGRTDRDLASGGFGPAADDAGPDGAAPAAEAPTLPRFAAGAPCRPCSSRFFIVLFNWTSNLRTPRVPARNPNSRSGRVAIV